MHCLLLPTPDDQRPTGGDSDFESLFGDFVRENDALWWSVSGGSYSPWTLPPDWYGDEIEDLFYSQFEMTADFRHAIARAEVFRDAMKFLTDFWLEIYAFRDKPSVIKMESWAGTGLPLAAAIARGADYAFINVDGSYWAAFSSDVGLLRRFADDWSLARFVQVKKVAA